jgi:hypothetical protein
VHVLSYDRRRVEDVVAEAVRTDGRAYLEKIVQVSLAVPPVSHDRLRDMAIAWLREAMADRPLVAWDEPAWAALLDGGIDGYLVTLRDARRLVNVVPAALELCGDEVAAMDVVALEALRLFDSDIHDRLLGAADLLTGADPPFDFSSETERDRRRAAEAGKLVEGSAHPVATKAILRELFPAAAKHLGEILGPSPTTNARGAKRVAAKPVLLRYLHLALATVGGAVRGGRLAPLRRWLTPTPSAACSAALTTLASMTCCNACALASANSRHPTSLAAPSWR